MIKPILFYYSFEVPKNKTNTNRSDRYSCNGVFHPPEDRAILASIGWVGGTAQVRNVAAFGLPKGLTFFGASILFGATILSLANAKLSPPMIR